MPVGRESGMPEVAYWESFFDPDCMLSQLGISRDIEDVAEFGCGYGTFTIPAARLISGVVKTLDIDPEMVQLTKRRADDQGIENVIAAERDFVTHGTGLPDASIDFVMLFNILHIEQPHILLREAQRILKFGCRVGIIHWRTDIVTPRGPSMSIRPSIEQCRVWGEQAGFGFPQVHQFRCSHWHWGLTMSNLGRATNTSVIPCVGL